MNETIETAYLAGGCFWCIEGPLQKIKGIKSLESGYMGGEIPNPSYQQICSGTTGHAEVVKIEFDNSIINFETLLTIFFHLHDPTSLNQQGNDKGTQYRSAIFFVDDIQLNISQKVIQNQQNKGHGRKSFVTTLEPLSEFYSAGEAHQNYYQKQPYQPYCQIMIAPKIEKISTLFKEHLS